MSLGDAVKAKFVAVFGGGSPPTTEAAISQGVADAIGQLLPAKAVVLFNLSSGDISGSFTSGLGNAAGTYAGWAICDGSNGTPNLANVFPRMVTGAAAGTGGADTVNTSAPTGTTVVASGVGATVASSTHTHNSNDNRPAYYQLTALMRVA